MPSSEKAAILGIRVYEKEIERGGTKLIEIAYGWIDISNLQRSSAT